MIIMLLRDKRPFSQLLLLPSSLISLDQCKLKLLNRIHYSEKSGWEYQFKELYLLVCSTLELKCKLEYSQSSLGKTTRIVRVVFIKTIIFTTWIILASSDFLKMVKPNAMHLAKSIIIWMCTPINLLQRQISLIELLMANKLTQCLLLNLKLREWVKIKTICSGLMVKSMV